MAEHLRHEMQAHALASGEDLLPAHADMLEEQLRTIQKKFQAVEGQFDCCNEDLFNATIKLEEREKIVNNCEGDVGGLTRRIVLLEDELERSEERLGQAIKDLCIQCRRADETVRKRILAENLQASKEESIDVVEPELFSRSIIQYPYTNRNLTLPRFCNPPRARFWKTRCFV